MRDRTVEAKLGGFYSREADSTQYADLGWMYALTSWSDFRTRFFPSFFRFCTSGNVRRTFKMMSYRSRKVVIHDARVLEQERGLSKQDFFDQFGFVLLPHASAMTASDWLESGQGTAAPDESVDEQARRYERADTPAKRIYAAECTKLVQQLRPDARDIFAPALGIRRGPGAPMAYYSPTVHSDFPLDFDDAAAHSRALCLDVDRKRFAIEDAREYYLLNFWRPVLPMQAPLQARPLCFCDPQTVRAEDLVPTQLDGQLPGGQRFLGFKYHPRQRWYYYPEMTADEVLVFKQCHYRKGEEAHGEIPVCHTSFAHRDTPKGAEARCSFEYRVSFLA